MDNKQFLEIMDKVEIYDLTQPLSIHTPPWPGAMPLQIRYFKRISGCYDGGAGANEQIITVSQHVGTHMDGELHFCSNGRPIGAVPLEHWVGHGVIVDISEEVSDFSLYSQEMLMDNADIRKGDILIINTGYHRYNWPSPEADEERYIMMHPGPSPGFEKWCAEMKFKWLGFDTASAEHPMNGPIRNWRPDLFAQAEEKLKKQYHKTWDEMFPRNYYRSVMHRKLFPKGIVHAENIGGEIDKLNNQRVWIGAFPWRAVEMESSICRIMAMKFS